MLLLIKGVCIVYLAKSFQGRTKYNIDTQHLVAVLKERGQPPVQGKLHVGTCFSGCISLQLQQTVR